MAITAASSAFVWPGSGRVGRWIAAVVALIGSLVVAGYVGLSIGQGRTLVHSIVGSGYSARQAISIKAGDSWYAVPLSVRWQSANGSWHEDGRPACLPPTGHVGPVRLGTVPVIQGNTAWDAIVWVSCKR